MAEKLTPEQINDLLKEKLDLQEKSIAEQEKELNLQKEILSRSQEQETSYRGRIVQLTHQIELLQTESSLIDRKVKSGLMSHEQALQLKAELEKQHALLKLNVEEMEQYVVTTQDAVTAAKELGNEFGSIFAAFGKNQYLNSDNFIKLGKSIQGGEASLIGFGNAMSNVGLKSFVDSMLGLVFELDKSETAFRRATGANQAFTREVTAGYERTRLSTVSIEANNAAWQALYQSYTDFTLISPEARKEIGDTTAVLSKLGISAADSAKGMQVATKAMGQTGAGAAGTLREIAALATDIGEPPQKLAQQFSAMAPSMAKLGDEMGDSFKRLARIQKLTGLEMGRLLHLTDKFDTFEGAAEMTGKLNAALGGNFVNAMDMMMETDPAARFTAIRDSLEDAGLTFDKMSYYQRKFFADSLGLSDVSELAALMSGDMEGAGVETMKTSAEYADMADRAREMASVQEKFNAMLQSMIPIVEPLIDNLNAFANWLTASDGRVRAFTYTLTGLWIGFKLLRFWTLLSTKAAMKQAAASSAQAAAAAQQAAANSALAPTQTAVGRTAGAAAPGMAAFAATTLGIGVGVGAAAGGIALMVMAFKELFDVMAGPGLDQFGGFIATIALGAPLMFLAGLGLAAMGIGFGAMALGLWGVNAKKLESIAEFTTALANTSISEMKQVTAEIENVVEAMDRLPEYKATVLEQVLKTTANAMGAGKGATERSRDFNRSPEKIEIVLKLDRKVLAREVRLIGGMDQAAANRGEGTPP